MLSFASVVRGPVAALVALVAVAPAVMVTVAVAAALRAAPAQATPLDDDGGLNLDPTSNEYQRCRRPDGREGFCVIYLQCFGDDFTLASGGQIYQNDIRDGAAPISNCGHNLWCCTNASTPAPQQRRPGPDAECLRAADDGCPWCVALYRPGGDVARGQRTPSGLYCAGALVGARVVLTSASCVRTVAEEAIWARVPASAAPAHRYTVVNKVTHERYNTATHANDFGLLVLNERVSFARSPPGACVSLRAPPRGSCLAAGFDDQEQVVMTAVTVRDGDCRPRKRNISDAACGTVASDASCAAAPGAPVLCPLAADGQGGRVVAGVVRRRCMSGSADLGQLQQHAGWLQQQLARLGVPAAQYSV